VDAADYVLWRKDPNAFGGTPAGYNTWRENFGNPAAGGAGIGAGSATAIPEPTACILVVVSAIMLMGVRARFGSTECV
jgi:hypothetical protein